MKKNNETEKWSLEIDPEETSTLLKFLTDKKRRRVILDPITNKLYMLRYFLLNKNKNEENDQTKFNIFLHKIMLSDTRHFHDHPWNYITIILKGGYWENTPTGKFWRGPGSIRFNRAKNLHYLELKNETPCMTLFIRFKARRQWGFIVDNQWIHNKLYFAGKYFNNV